MIFDIREAHAISVLPWVPSEPGHRAGTRPRRGSTSFPHFVLLQIIMMGDQPLKLTRQEMQTCHSEAHRLLLRQTTASQSRVADRWTPLNPAMSSLIHIGADTLYVEPSTLAQPANHLEQREARRPRPCCPCLTRIRGTDWVWLRWAEFQSWWPTTSASWGGQWWVIMEPIITHYRPSNDG